MGITALLSLQVHNEQDLVRARQRARQVVDGLHFDLHGQAKFVAAVSEIVRNAYRYAGGGRASFAVIEDGPPAIEVVVADRGPGIADVPAVLEGRGRTGIEAGMGIVGARRLMDRFDLRSAPGEGTTVRMTKFVPLRCRTQLGELLPRLTRDLAQQMPQNPLSEIEHQNQELMRILDELRQRQEELSQLNRELEDTNRGVVALHAELDTQALALRRALALKSRFLSHMTHEFRSPLNSIFALSELLLQGIDGPLGEEQARQVTFIKRSCEQLGDLVNDLLDLGRVEAGKVAMRPEEFPLEELFGALKGMLRPLIQQRDAVRLEFDPADAIPRLYGDQGKVSQILRNLIANALKFTERGEVRVSARLQPGERVRIAVRDTGIGISSEDQELVFDEYTQVESAQRHVRGTGLGLPLSRRLAELLGGRLTVESRLGEGSTFTLELPLRYTGSQELRIVRDSGRLRSQAKRPVVLVIDDQEVSRYLLRSMLPRGVELVEAAGGAQGLDLARRHGPRAIFLDLAMPEMGGEAVLAELRADERMARIPVIIYTASEIDAGLRARLGPVADIVSKRAASREEAGEAVLRALASSGVLPEGG